MKYQEIKEHLSELGQCQESIELSAAYKVLEYLEAATEMQRDLIRDLEKRYTETPQFKRQVEEEHQRQANQQNA